MIFANRQEIIRAKQMALLAYREWKDARLEPLVERWVAEGCDPAEIAERLDAYVGEVREEAARVLRLVTLAALRDGAFDDS